MYFCSFTSFDLGQSEATCSAYDNTTMTFTTTLVYSTESGDMTASTLIRMFQDRAASTSTVISVGSQTATIVSVCSPSCIPETQPSPTTSTPELQPSPMSTPELQPSPMSTPELQPSPMSTPELQPSSMSAPEQQEEGRLTSNAATLVGINIPGRTCYWYGYPHYYSSHCLVSLHMTQTLYTVLNSITHVGSQALHARTYV